MKNLTNHFMPVVGHETLPNGLSLHLVPRPEFHQLIAMVTVDFGARDQVYLQDGQQVVQPAGLAHFLEHKMFAQPGYDAFTKLSELGDNSNAFTSQTRTSYFVTSQGYQYAGLKELLNFTQTPYFDETEISKEAKIIGQEIDMYQDDPASRLYRAIMARLYPGDPLAEDIAGTVESVESINSVVLQHAFDLNYQPKKMDVVIAGAFDALEVRDIVKDAFAQQSSADHVAEFVQTQLQPVEVEPLEIDLETVRNKVAIGQRFFENQVVPTGIDAIKQASALSLVMDLVFSEFSPVYMEWYDEGLIDDSFSVEFDWERGFAFVNLISETPEPESLIDVVSTELNQITARFVELSDAFELVKKDALGRLINKLNSLEEIVTRFEGQTFGGAMLSDEITILQNLSQAETLAILKTVKTSPVASVIARPN